LTPEDRRIVPFGNNPRLIGWEPMA